MQPDPVPTTSATELQTHAKDMKHLGSSTEKSNSDLQKWLESVVSDDEMDVADIESDGQTDGFVLTVHDPLTPAFIFDDIHPDLHTWLTNNDQNSDQMLRGMIQTDQLTFHWVPDHNTFRGKRESFTGIAGPTFPLTDDTSPLDIFLKFFDDEVFDLIVRQTNNYATRLMDQDLTRYSRLKHFNNVDRGEIAKFLAILILQGLLPNPVEPSYWGDNGYLTLINFREIMTYNKFVLLKRLIHFSETTDSETLSTNEKKLWKIKPVLDLLQKRFSALYLPQQEIAIDESLLKWQGKLSFAQRIATKAARVGIESYELCESASGYLWKFFVYTGKTDEQTDTVLLPLLTNATSKIVHDLMKPLYNRGHTLIMDNFYNSPLLARFLKLQGTDCFGTLRVNREFVPEAIKSIQKHELREGELVQSYTEDLSVVMWRDSNVVSLVSTYHQGVVGGAEKYGRFKYKPQVVLDYNLAMGGVDKKDQLLSAFPIERVRNTVWYKKVFRRLLNITLMNAHIIFKSRHKQYSPREFRRQVAEGLIKMTQPPAIARPMVTVETMKLALARQSKKLRPILKGNHYICSGPSRMALCKWCKKSRTKYICQQCDVSLCLGICFKEYHTVP